MAEQKPDRAVTLLEEAKKRYPYLNSANLVAIESPANDGRMLEYWPSGEPGSESSPRPADIPLMSPGIQVFSEKTTPLDVLADYASHEGVRSDKKLKELYSQFSALVPEQTMRKRYAEHQKQFGESRPFESWRETTGMPEYFRGYTFDQWKDPKKFYTQEQLGKLDEVRKYLGIASNEVGDKQSAMASDQQQATVTVDVQGFGKVNFPATFTPEQIEQAIERDVLPQAKNKAPADEFKMEPPGAWARAGRGAQDVVDRLSQLTIGGMEKVGMVAPGISDIATQNMQAEREEFNAKKDPDKFDLAGLAGNAGMQAPLALLPGGKGTLASRIFAGAAQGGASGALQFDPTNSLAGAAKNVGVGAGVGAVAAPAVGYLGDKLGEAVRFIAGRAKGLGAKLSGEASEAAIMKAVPELQTMTPEERIPLIEEAKKQIAKMGSLDDAAMSRKANLVANEITPTKSMVTRDPADWTLERNLQKLAQSPDEQLSTVGRDLTDVYQGNDAAMTRQLDKLGANVPKATQEGYGMTVMKSIDDLADASQKDVGAIYEQIKVAKGADLASDAKNLRGTLDDLKDSAYAEKLVTSVTNRLKRFGMLDKDGDLTSNTLTVSQAEELRKFVNTLPNDFGKRDIIRAIDTDVFEGAGEDAFKAARDKAAERFGMLGNPATQKALNAYGELTQGKTAQNFIKTQVIDAAAQDVKTLVTTLGKIGDDAKKTEAMNAMKGGVLSYLQSKAINPNSGKFSGAALNKAVLEIGDEKLALTLGKAEADKLKSLARAALDATYEPAYSAVNHAGTAPMLMSLMQKARTIPGIPLLVTDEAQKVAARSGYQNQLADVLAAQAGELPQAPQSVARLAEALRLAAPPAAATALNQQRQPANKKPKDRK